MLSQHPYSYPQGSQRNHSNGDYMNQEVHEAGGGCDMTMSYSTDSYFSTSGLSTSSTNTLESLPTTPAFQDSGSSTEFGGSDYGTPMPQNFEQSFNPKLPAPAGHRSRNSKPTPSSLGWTLQTEFLTLYKFIVGKGDRQPYFELLVDEGAQLTEVTPQRVYLDQPRHPSKGVFPCMYPGGCRAGKQKSFSRPADLERHYKNVHAKIEQKDRFPCDYPKCVRSTKGAQVPFTRKDHYRDHLRDFHKEDLGAAKFEKTMRREEWEAQQKQWLSERVIYPHYWRCTKCLDRITVAVSGWECPRCKSTCEIERSDARKRLIPGEDLTARRVSAHLSCLTCEGRGWTDNGYGMSVDCYQCNSSYETKRHASDERIIPKTEQFDNNVGVALPCADCTGVGYHEDGYGEWVCCVQCQPRSESSYHTGGMAMALNDQNVETQDW